MSTPPLDSSTEARPLPPTGLDEIIREINSRSAVTLFHDKSNLSITGVERSSVRSPLVDPPISFGSISFSELLFLAQKALAHHQQQTSVTSRNRAFSTAIEAANTFKEQAHNMREGADKKLIFSITGAMIGIMGSSAVIYQAKGRTLARPTQAEQPTPGQRTGTANNSMNIGPRSSVPDGQSRLEEGRAGGAAGGAPAGAQDQASLPPDSRLRHATSTGDGDAYNQYDALNAKLNAMNAFSSSISGVFQNIGQYLETQHNAINSELSGLKASLDALVATYSQLQSVARDSLSSTTLQSMGQYIQIVNQVRGTISEQMRN